MAIISVPKPLRDKLGEEATDSLIELLKENEEGQKNHLFDIVEERFERRLLESEARLRREIQGVRDEMHSGFLGIQKDFSEVQKQFSEVHKAIANQTKWILGAILAGAVIYPLAVKLVDRLFQ
ncbi:MAG: hypothetical protein OEV78_09830 [Spirochaetia bacterium]|nr:hypothetical protein [Spirochaetia bacterium]